MQVIFACVYGADTTLRLKQAGMEYAVWVFKHADDAQLAPMAPVVLQGLLRLLDAGAGSVEARTVVLRASMPNRWCYCVADIHSVESQHAHTIKRRCMV